MREKVVTEAKNNLIQSLVFILAYIIIL